MTLVIVFSSCNRGPLFEEVYNFTDNTWQRIEEDLRFEVEIEDEEQRYDIDIPIRYTGDYPHQYLEVGINIYAPSGQENINVRKIYLVDENLHRRGEQSGEVWDYTFRLFDEYKFNERGTYIVEIQNLTGNNFYLRGISRLGLEVRRSKEGSRD